MALGGLKIDLSRLFGAPDGSEDAATIAARERDEQLLMAGRQAFGLNPTSSTASRTPSPTTSHSTSPNASPDLAPNASPAGSPAARSGQSSVVEKDELDSLIDALDDLNL